MEQGGTGDRGDEGFGGNFVNYSLPNDSVAYTRDNGRIITLKLDGGTVPLPSLLADAEAIHAFNVDESWKAYEAQRGHGAARSDT